MKKFSKFRGGLFFALGIFLFTACENFLNGSLFKDQIQADIDYVNSSACLIKVEAVKNTGTIKSPATGEVEKKVTNTFPVKFESADNCRFIKWDAYSPSLSRNEKISDYIEFEDENALETKVTFLKAKNDIIIRPVCPAKITLESFNLNDSKKVYPRDSSVVLLFNQVLNENCLENITINIPELSEEKSFRDYFKLPVRNEKQVLFETDIDWDDVREEDFIPVEKNETKTIQIIIPEKGLYYTDSNYSEPVDIYLEKELVLEYRINSDTDNSPVENVRLDGSNGKFSPS